MLHFLVSPMNRLNQTMSAVFVARAGGGSGPLVQILDLLSGSGFGLQFTFKRMKLVPAKNLLKGVWWRTYTDKSKVSRNMKD